MAETTAHEAELTRQEAATFLRSIADELASGRSKIRVGIGNKEVELSPPERISAAAVVTERSRRLRKDTEELQLVFDWYPTKETAAAPEDESG